MDTAIIYNFFRSGASTGRSSTTGSNLTGSNLSGSGSRAGTPSRASSFDTTSANNSNTASILAEADRRRELRNYVFNPVGKTF